MDSLQDKAKQTDKGAAQQEKGTSTQAGSAGDGAPPKADNDIAKAHEGYEAVIKECNVKAAGALPPDHENDIDKLKTVEPWLFGTGAPPLHRRTQRSYRRDAQMRRWTRPSFAATTVTERNASTSLVCSMVTHRHAERAPLEGQARRTAFQRFPCAEGPCV